MRFKKIGIAAVVLLAAFGMCSRQPEQITDTTQTAEASTEAPDAEVETVVELQLIEKLNLEYLDQLEAGYSHAIAVQEEFLNCRAADIYLDARAKAREENIGTEEVLIRKLKMVKEHGSQAIDGKVEYSFDAEGNDQLESPANDVAALFSLLRDLADGELDLDLHCEIAVNEYWDAVDGVASAGIALLREQKQEPQLVTKPVEADDEGEADE